ncbi:uncharacterized protein LOC131012108 [Salvia miltiorrhiza]|uniref:uncharacterized protein LOC130997818 n=1 Tax=Salvia miltiorrhiza TaxID=226208 RepID=UPI0025AD6F71|nr:uncharacterized protein LOC130997818 [Salvia miltiorrhiza]XP_057796006.1 uncharacterized protein LOC131012108 [Salvia miltiorrhiza]
MVGFLVSYFHSRRTHPFVPSKFQFPFFQLPVPASSRRTAPPRRGAARTRRRLSLPRPAAAPPAARTAQPHSRSLFANAGDSFNSHPALTLRRSGFSDLDK